MGYTKKAPPNPMQLPDVPPPEARCRATTAKRKQCRGWRRYGGFCHIHDPHGIFQNSGKTRRNGFVMYQDYLRSEHWHQFRKKALAHYGYRCTNCGTKADDAMLNIHHLTYETLWHESVDDVLLVCRSCHEQLHAP